MDYDHKSLSELHGLGICISISCHPYESPAFGRCTIIGPVPAFAEIIGKENKFTIPVKNLHVVFCHITGMERPEYVIQSVVVWGKGVGKSKLATAYPSCNMHCSGIISATIVCNHLVDAGIADGIR